MSGLRKLTAVELKLFLREPSAYVWTVIFPVLLLVILGSIPGFRQADPELGNLRVIDLYIPIIVVMILAMMTLYITPGTITGYRQKGVLRRLSTTPIGAVRVLVAQLAVQLGFMVVTVVLTLVTAAILFGAVLPRQGFGFVLALALVAAAMLAIGLLIAALVPTASAATGIGTALFFPLMFFGGLWVPREGMPDVLVRIGDFTPLGAGVQALRDSSDGNWPSAVALAVLAAYAIAAGALAARYFRWE
ncbi:ABC transporter permease [Micromonospora sp. NBC_01796]|uniref:ABC transporter permease n=1 Tax=Micromonospora sp. NBC_01796 TaxID=2975987 RepID=UPI002DD9EAA3|nr:ABC transporter permease [Micromonospora sp. NBC_01796]WSA87870.1 ABC transporter permease [Micromonospora sp. NBC_01796]